MCIRDRAGPMQRSSWILVVSCRSDLARIKMCGVHISILVLLIKSHSLLFLSQLSKRGHETSSSHCQSHFPPTDPRCHGNEIRDKIGYNSACVRDICEIFCICGGVFGNGPSNAANWILPRPTLVHHHRHHHIIYSFNDSWHTTVADLYG